MKKVIYFLILLMTTAFVSCSNEDSDTDERQSIVMPVNLSIPATDGMGTRAGDPGEAEQFTLPKYAYIYIICKDETTNEDVVVNSSFRLNDNSWTMTHIANGDSVYQYKGDIHVYLPIIRSETGIIYAALSSVKLPELPTTETSSTGKTEVDVQNYKYQLTDSVYKELKNIYSTPYNNRPNGTEYYGTAHNFNELKPSIDLILYHVASRLDLEWNVPSENQDTSAIKTLTVSVPSAKECYIFKPLDNALTETKRDTTFTTTIGNQWYGRAYTYVIPMTGTNDTYTFDATVSKTNGKIRTSNGIPAGTINKNQPFVPWMRGFITVH